MTLAVMKVARKSLNAAGRALLVPMRASVLPSPNRAACAEFLDKNSRKGVRSRRSASVRRVHLGDRAKMAQVTFGLAQDPERRPGFLGEVPLSLTGDVAI
jgi:hypothetical protein